MKLMKNTLVAGILLIMMAFGFSSCQKCYTCDFGNGNIREICSKDLPDGNAGLKLTIDGYEQRGYKCTRK
jgi:hypothetical protein